MAAPLIPLWDQRLAAWLVRPLAAAPVTPNMITALGLTLGLTAAVLFAVDRPGWGGSLFGLSLLADHADGELARRTGNSSRCGHIFDRVTSALCYTFVFIGMGLGAGLPKPFGLIAGLVSGATMAAIFALRNLGERRLGATATEQRQFAGFSSEDVMYLVCPLGWFGAHGAFVVLAAVGAPVYFLLVTWKNTRQDPIQKS